jgi:alpha-1,4-digalacturonate transport system permease protein
MSARPVAPHHAKRAAGVRAALAQGAVLVLLTLAAVVFLIPIFWMVSTALKSNPHVFDLPIQWVPRPPLWGNFPEAYATVGFTHYFVNSAIVTGSVTLINVTLAALAGYGLAKYRFAGNHLLLVLMLTTLMLPLEVIMVPLYLTMEQLHWLNSYQGMIVPVAANAIGVPLAWPAILTVAVLIFQSTWDDFVWPFLIISNTSKATVPLAVQIFQSAETSNFPELMAVSLIASLPLTVLFLVFQRQIIGGVVTTGLRQ